MARRSNTARTHYQHVDRVHTKRLVELATSLCENVTDVSKMNFDEVSAEWRSLNDCMVQIQAEMLVAKQSGRADDAILIGNRIQALHRRLGVIGSRRKEIHREGIAFGKRCLKQAMREILSPEQVAAIFARSNELEASALAKATSIMEVRQ